MATAAVVPRVGTRRPAPGGAVTVGAALALAAPWRRFPAEAPAARAAFLGS